MDGINRRWFIVIVPSARQCLHGLRRSCWQDYYIVAGERRERCICLVPLIHSKHCHGLGQNLQLRVLLGTATSTAFHLALDLDPYSPGTD